MKKLIILIGLVLAVICSFGQTAQPGGSYKTLKATEYFSVPYDTTRAPKYVGEIRYRTADGIFYRAVSTVLAKKWDVFAADSRYVAITGTQSVAGVKTYSNVQKYSSDLIGAYDSRTLPDWGNVQQAITDSLNDRQAIFLDAKFPVVKNVFLGVNEDTVQYAIDTTISTLTDGATITWDLKTSTMATVTIAGNRTLAFTNPVRGYYTLKVIQGSGGSHALTLPAGSKVANGGGGAVTLSTAASAVDILTFWYDGTNYWWNVGLNYN